MNAVGPVLGSTSTGRASLGRKARPGFRIKAAHVGNVRESVIADRVKAHVRADATFGARSHHPKDPATPSPTSVNAIVNDGGLVTVLVARLSGEEAHREE